MNESRKRVTKTRTREQKDLEGAKGYYLKCLAIREKVAPDSLDLASTLYELAAGRTATAADVTATSDVEPVENLGRGLNASNQRN